MTTPTGNGALELQAMAYLYDHVSEFPAWVQHLTPGQMQQLAGLLTRWRAGDQNSAVRPLDEIEKEQLIHALTVFNGDVSAAARALRIGKTTLYRRLKEWGFGAENWRLMYQAAVLCGGSRTRT